MVRITSDSSVMFNTRQAAEMGFALAPLSVTIDGRSYRELDEIQTDAFVEIIRQGHLPTSSQPAVGEVAEMFEAIGADEVIHISMADGLSGAYQSACAAAEMVDAERITVVNSRTLCGPHRHMVFRAVEMAKAGCTKAEILEKLHSMIENNKSFLIPSDFDYLRRGGRLKAGVAYVGKALRLVPLMTQTEDGRRLMSAAIKRTFAQAVEHAAGQFAELQVGKGWVITVTHSQAAELARQAADKLKAAFPHAEVEVLPLTPAFTTQGGPGCVALQAVRV